MTSRSRVVWSQGLFLTPEHLQQQDRHIEGYVERRCRSLVPFSWGFTQIDLDRALLGVGELSVRQAAGVFPDGTPFRVPEDAPPITSLKFATGVYNEVVYLAIPGLRDDTLAFGKGPRLDELTRYEVREVETRDVTAEAESGEPARVAVGELRARWLRSSEVTAEYSCLPAARVLHCGNDGRLVIDEEFVPTVLEVGASERLARFLMEVIGYLRDRGDELGRRLAAGGRSIQADVPDLLMLQMVNRYEPLLVHLANERPDGRSAALVHPEELYRVLASAAGEFATITTDSKRPARFPAYRHDRLKESFEPLIEALRRALSHRQRELAMPIPLEDRDDVKVGLVPDPGLYSSAEFVLAAKAQMPEEQLRRRLPASVKIAPVSKIGSLITQAVPGVPISAKAVAPAQIPLHSGFVYFAFDQSHPMWGELKTSSGIAFFVPQLFPELELELWAIRRPSG